MISTEELEKSSLFDEVTDIEMTPPVRSGDDRILKIRGFHAKFRTITRTPAIIRRTLQREFKFTGEINAMAEGVYEEELLKKPWFKSSFVIPNTSNMGKWVQKMAMECEAGRTVVAICPGRTNTEWFHDFALKYVSEVRFIRGRLTFPGYTKQNPFPSVIIVYDPKVLQWRRDNPEWNGTELDVEKAQVAGPCSIRLDTTETKLSIVSDFTGDSGIKEVSVPTKKQDVRVRRSKRRRKMVADAAEEEYLSSSFSSEEDTE